MAELEPEVIETGSYRVAFTVGSRQLASFERRVVTMAFSLEQVLAARIVPPPPIGSADGLRVLSVPSGRIDAIRAHFPGFILGAEQVFERSYIDMTGGFEAYMNGFSGKTRSTLRRKRRKLEQAGGGGELDVRLYRTPDEMEEFLARAGALSRRTYQARLLDAGLPEDGASRNAMKERAAEGMVRAFLLFLKGEPIAYLYLPVEGETLVYAHLGYDPAHAALSPGTVLQMAALEALFAEERFRYFDFTEGQGPHKALFGTHGVACASFLLLRPSIANRALLASVRGFDRAVAKIRRIAERAGVEPAVRKLLRK